MEWLRLNIEGQPVAFPWGPDIKQIKKVVDDQGAVFITFVIGTDTFTIPHGEASIIDDVQLRTALDLSP